MNTESQQWTPEIAAAIYGRGAYPFCELADAHNAALDEANRKLDRELDISERLNNQLLSALAAIEKHNQHRSGSCYIVASVDLSLLHERDKELLGMNQYLKTFVTNWPQVHKAIRSDIMLSEAAEEIQALAGLYYEISGDGRGAGHTDRRNRRTTKETLHLQPLPCPACGTKPEQPPTPASDIKEATQND
jgi:hypothetical protein